MILRTAERYRTIRAQMVAAALGGICASPGVMNEIAERRTWTDEVITQSAVEIGTAAADALMACEAAEADE